MDNGTLIPIIDYTLDPDRNTVGRISSELKLPEKAGLEFLWLPMPCSLLHSKWVVIFRIYGLTKVILIFLKAFD
ncbi:hypothetical protein E1A91_D12G217400v1 [Gossypium mustelinum]|uniref:Uncharacterized protein n=1 Tax=Gossypium mustelinum TaxID=34275 RepID=A0A5D2SH49_GOSMU|nr:hypothetical protein E1A91_D12G217400v1 [Gossypium mustelinum]